MSRSLEREILGLHGAVDDRRLLGLPDSGRLRSGQIEAALEERMTRVARHPAGRTDEAHGLLVALEQAADRLQAELALAGQGPLHPQAAKRAAARIAREEARAAGRRAVVAPAAASLPGAGISSEDLTDFDRLALAILVVSGGWNARSAKRLAAIAEDHGIPVEQLERVVDGLTHFLSEGDGMRGAMGNVGREARAAWYSPKRATRLDEAESRVERVFTRLDDALRDEIQGDRFASKARLIAVFALFAISWIVGLSWLFFGGGKADDATQAARPTAELPWIAPATPAAPAPGPGATGANGEPIEPPPVLAAPAKFPRPPGFVPTATPTAVREGAAGAAAHVGSLEVVARALRTNRGRLDGQNLAEATDALARLADAWPALGDAREGALRAIVGLAAEVRGDESLVRLMQAMPGEAAKDGGVPPRSIGSFTWTGAWRNAFGAGALAVLATDRALASEASAAARQEMRLRAIAIPRADAVDPFAAAALASLAADAPRLADGLSTAALGIEDASRWSEAVLAADADPAVRVAAWIAAIDAALRAPGAIDVPGALVDFLAFAIRSIDFTGRAAESDRMRDALASWIVDKAIPPSRIWVFTSLLDADLGIAWFGPDLIAATDATAEARMALAERALAAYPQASRTGAGEAVLVEAAALAQWRKASEGLRALGDQNEALRLRNAAALLALARAARAFEKDDGALAQGALAEARALVERSIEEWEASPTGERAGLPASGVVDGEWAREWESGTRDSARRIELARSLGQRPASGDLGPIDARRAATEVLRSNQPEVRAALATVLVDRYARGREVLLATLDALAEGSTASDATEYISKLVGMRVGGPRWHDEARRLIIERLWLLEDRREHMIDETFAEIAAASTALARAYGAAGVQPPAGSAAFEQPATLAPRALAAAVDAMRDEAGRRFLAAPFPAPADEIERMRGVRRSLARSATQALAAETPAIVEHAAALVVARQPALRSQVEEMLAAGRRARVAAGAASLQVELDLRTLVEILGAGLAPAPTRRDG